eukprot:1161917-Pelagomonas_calceolata.AAC.1
MQHQKVALQTRHAQPKPQSTFVHASIVDAAINTAITAAAAEAAAALQAFKGFPTCVLGSDNVNYSSKV